MRFEINGLSATLVRTPYRGEAEGDYILHVLVEAKELDEDKRFQFCDKMEKELAHWAISMMYVTKLDADGRMELRFHCVLELELIDQLRAQGYGIRQIE